MHDPCGKPCSLPVLSSVIAIRKASECLKPVVGTVVHQVPFRLVGVPTAWGIGARNPTQ